MKKIDAHQHFWKFDPQRDAWINEEMKVIQRDFLPQDLERELIKNNFEGCVAIQSDQSEEENTFQLHNAEKFDFIKGVVGWTDFEADNIEERLQFYTCFNKMKGFRHILQGELKRDKMLQPAFMKSVGLLKKYGFTYDILVLPDQLQYLPSFVTAFPDQPFVIDHIAKPNIKDKKIDDWKRDMMAVSQFENVYCKVSGMVTEANWKNWKREDFTPYLEVIMESFGTDRIMFGSDWPVCLVAASYEEVLGIAGQYFSGLSKDEQDKIFATNAIKFYKL